MNVVRPYRLVAHARAPPWESLLDIRSHGKAAGVRQVDLSLLRGALEVRKALVSDRGLPIDSGNWVRGMMSRAGSSFIGEGYVSGEAI